MKMFSTILAKLGFGGDKVEAAKQPALPAETAAILESTAPAMQAISDVNTVAKFAALASTSAEKLNLKVSIVDLMKLLSLDRSLAAGKELGCPAEKIVVSARMTMWLQKTVLQKNALNGGNILLDPHLLHP